MGVKERIQAQEYAEIDHGGLRYRLRRVVSRDLLDQGYALILSASARAQPGRTHSPESIVEALRRDGEYLGAICCAAVVAIDGGEGWEPWTLTLGAEDLDAHRIGLASLPGGAPLAIAQAAIQHACGAKEDDPSAVATFLRALSAAAGPNREEVRRAAE